MRLDLGTVPRLIERILTVTVEDKLTTAILDDLS
jgi:hypothetical protein